MAKIPNWNGKQSAVRATQVAFELEQRIIRSIHEMAAKNGLNPSSQIRKILGLPFTPPVRPRLTVTLNEEDYKILALRYGLEPSDTLRIKQSIMQELYKIGQSSE
jgi:hypothetical protein